MRRENRWKFRGVRPDARKMLHNREFESPSKRGRQNGVLSTDHGKSDKPTKIPTWLSQRARPTSENCKTRNSALMHRYDRPKVRGRRKAEGKLTGRCWAKTRVVNGGWWSSQCFIFRTSTPIMKYVQRNGLCGGIMDEPTFPDLSMCEKPGVHPSVTERDDVMLLLYPRRTPSSVPKKKTKNKSAEWPCHSSNHSSYRFRSRSIFFCRSRCDCLVDRLRKLGCHILGPLSGRHCLAGCSIVCI